MNQEASGAPYWQALDVGIGEAPPCGRGFDPTA